MKADLSVRPMEVRDIPQVINYWEQARPDYLVGMGVELGKMPPPETLAKLLKEQIEAPLTSKRTYALIWEIDSKPSGHSNVNKIVYGVHAYMHLHLWQAEYRRKGWGEQLVKMSLPYFFENLKLGQLWCEPFALNPAPHRTLEKVGFEFEKEYITTPGSINFLQPVKRWGMSRDKYNLL